LIGFAAQHQIRLKIYRIFQVFGEGEQASRLWPSLRMAAIQGLDFPMTAGEQLRDFINVTDVAAMFVRALNFRDVQHGLANIVNIGTGQTQSLADFAKYWWKEFGATGELRLGQVPYRENEMMRLLPELGQDSSQCLTGT
jgi:nucleoside-diphosphate-sugar epimerase